MNKENQQPDSSLVDNFVVRNEADYEKLLQIIEEQKAIMDLKLEMQRKELEAVVRQKQQEIQARDKLLKEIAACDEKTKEMELKLFAADADIIMEEYTVMEECWKKEALALEVARAGKGSGRPHTRVPENGTPVMDFLNMEPDEEGEKE